MKIDVLYFSGCPNSAPTLRRLFGVLSLEDVVAEVDEINIVTESDAKRYQFVGSPSIRIDGSDIEPAARIRGDFALICRTYPDGSGVPPLDMITRAVREHLAAPNATPESSEVHQLVRIIHRPTGTVIAEGPLGWGIMRFEGNYYIGRRHLKATFKPNFLPGFCIYKFLYVWMDLMLPNGERDGSLGWLYWLPNPLLPFIWYRVAVPQHHPSLEVEHVASR